MHRLAVGPISLPRGARIVRDAPKRSTNSHYVGHTDNFSGTLVALVPQFVWFFWFHICGSLLCHIVGMKPLRAINIELYSCPKFRENFKRRKPWHLSIHQRTTALQLAVFRRHWSARRQRKNTRAPTTHWKTGENCCWLGHGNQLWQKQNSRQHQ